MHFIIYLILFFCVKEKARKSKLLHPAVYSLFHDVKTTYRNLTYFLFLLNKFSQDGEPGINKKQNYVFLLLLFILFNNSRLCFHTKPQLYLLHIWITDRLRQLFKVHPAHTLRVRYWTRRLGDCVSQCGSLTGSFPPIAWIQNLWSSSEIAWTVSTVPGLKTQHHVKYNTSDTRATQEDTIYKSLGARETWISTSPVEKHIECRSFSAFKQQNKTGLNVYSTMWIIKCINGLLLSTTNVMNITVLKYLHPSKDKKIRVHLVICFSFSKGGGGAQPVVLFVIRVWI